jgi:hypothetical protein
MATNTTNKSGQTNLPEHAGSSSSSSSSSAAAAAEAPFEAAFFLDNDYTYIFQVRPCEPKIIAHAVSGSMGTVPEVSLDSKPYKNLVKRLSPAGKAYAAAIAPLVKSGERIDEGSGIQERDIEAIGDWISEHEGQKLAVLFDYDRTLTVMEGGNFLGQTFEEMKTALGAPSLSVEGMAEYYAGGIKRLRRLQSMFDALYEIPRLTLYVLTNNPVCLQNVPLFTELLHVFTQGRPIKLLCSYAFRSNKRLAIQSDPLLAPLCPVKGGRRKTLRKKARSMRRR